jgi:UDP-3-O-[3-hydroxymyristoyl] glucosamine N-acyltransferase
MAQDPVAHSLQELASQLGGWLEYVDAAQQPGDICISGLASLHTAQPGQLSFLSKASFAHHLETTRASAVLVNESLSCDVNQIRVPLLRVKNAYLAYAQVSALFDTSPQMAAGIHPSAVVHPSARIAASACVGAQAVIEAGVVIGDETVIGAGVAIGANTQLGKCCHIYSNASIYHHVLIGDRVTIHANSVIGADGFGFAPKPGGGWQKIHQLGSVHIGNDVEIGANTTIDRGALDDTIIEDGAIIDNLVQIAHNVHIGKNTAIAGCTGIAGSARIGANCTLAGGVGLVGHITIADNVHITGMTMITSSITEPGSYSSGTGFADTRTWRRNAVRFSQLDELAKRLKEVEKK